MKSSTTDPEIHYFDPRFARLNAQERDWTAGILHLRLKTMLCLKRVGIETIGELLSCAEGGLLGLTAAGAGPRTFADLRAALTALGSAIRDEGTVDWERYAQERGFTLLPCSSRVPAAGVNLLEILPRVIEQILPRHFNLHQQLIFRTRYLVPDAPCQTGSQLGHMLGCTRQAVTFEEHFVIGVLQRIFLRNDYRGCT